MQFEVPVKYEGVVTVIVPDGELDEYAQRRLARQIALARIVATVTNPDAPDDDAFEELWAEMETEEEAPDYDELADAWDNTDVGATFGDWEIDDTRDTLAF